MTPTERAARLHHETPEEQHFKWNEVCVTGQVGLFNLTPCLVSYTECVMSCVAATTAAYHLLLCQYTIIGMYYAVPFYLSVHITAVGIRQVLGTKH